MRQLYGKTLVLIDGSNVYSAAKAIGVEIDWKLFSQFYNQKYNVLRFCYYTAVLTNAEGFSTLRPLIDYLQFNGYSVITKPARTYSDPNGEPRVKGNMDCEIITDMLSMVDRIENVILYSGDNDFCYAVRAVQQKGIFVQCVSTLTGRTPIMGDDLRRQCDEFVDLKDLVVEFTKAPRAKFSPISGDQMNG